MLAPASKNVATGGPFGSNGNGAVAGSSCTVPARPAPPGCGPSPVTGAAPCPRPRPRPPGCALLARIHTPDRSGLPSAVRGAGASARTLPCASRGTDGSTTFGHCAATDTEHATTMPITISFIGYPSFGCPRSEHVLQRELHDAGILDRGDAAERPDTEVDTRIARPHRVSDVERLDPCFQPVGAGQLEHARQCGVEAPVGKAVEREEPGIAVGAERRQRKRGAVEVLRSEPSGRVLIHIVQHLIDN